MSATAEPNQQQPVEYRVLRMLYRVDAVKDSCIVQLAVNCMSKSLKALLERYRGEKAAVFGAGGY